MNITILLPDASSTSAGKKRIDIKVEEPTSIIQLYKLAGDQEGEQTLCSELKGFMVSYNGVLLDYNMALNKKIFPGEKIQLIPIMEGG